MKKQIKHQLSVKHLSLQSLPDLDPKQIEANHCLLCDVAEPEFVGILVHDGHLNSILNAPAGKDRLVFYGVCVYCKVLPNSESLIEENIFEIARSA